MQNNTLDPQFWNMTTEDGYYVFDSDEIYKEDGTNDWELPFEDLDPDAPFCTPNDNKDFACKEIKCIHQRKNKTDDDYDVQFVVNASSSDHLTIAAGDAFIAIDMDTYSDADKYIVESWAAIELDLVKGAYTFGVTSALAAVSILAF